MKPNKDHKTGCVCANCELQATIERVHAADRRIHAADRRIQHVRRPWHWTEEFERRFQELAARGRQSADAINAEAAPAFAEFAATGVKRRLSPQLTEDAKRIAADAEALAAEVEAWVRRPDVAAEADRKYRRFRLAQLDGQELLIRYERAKLDWELIAADKWEAIADAMDRLEKPSAEVCGWVVYSEGVVEWLAREVDNAAAVLMDAGY